MSMFGQSGMGSKPTASLSSTLLARKGQAKPAMRPQGFGGFGTIPGAEDPGAQDDLGWNDMGFDAGHDVPPEPPVPPVPVPPVLVPPVLVQREVLREEMAQPTPIPTPAPAHEPEREIVAQAPLAVSKPVSVATATRIGRDTRKKHSKRHPKAAFTLRLDEDRHLRLRLASALHNASAQTLVTEALDQFLQSLPEVTELLRQLPARAAR